MNASARLRVVFALLVAMPALLGCSASRNAAPVSGGVASPGVYLRQSPFVTREFRPFIGGRWIGNAIAYGPHRDGQRPGGPSPTKAQMAEDLRLMLKHWHLLRVYGTVGPADSILDIIDRGHLDMRVMLGIWVQAEDRRDSTGKVLERFPEAAAANRREIEAGVRLAAKYPRLVLALCVGNETQVSWTWNHVATSRLVEIIREVRARSKAPVTSADDFNYWNKPESRAVAGEVDFIVTHAHPLWNGCQLGEAIAWTRKTLDEVRALHPGQQVVLGESGWATQHNDQGDQGKLMKGEVGEAQQAQFLEAMNAWVDQERIPTFTFEAFDENWKGGDRADDVEKHWGLFHADRSPKLAMAGKP